jgi:hypothetical protein
MITLFHGELGNLTGHPEREFRLSSGVDSCRKRPPIGGAGLFDDKTLDRAYHLIGIEGWRFIASAECSGNQDDAHRTNPIIVHIGISLTTSNIKAIV